MPSPDRAAEPVQARTEVGQLTLYAPQLARLEQGVNPPQPAPHLGPGAAEDVGRRQHPLRQHGPLGQAVGGAAGQLPGPQRVDQRDRIARRLGRGQRVPADRPGPLVLAPVHQRLRVAGRDPGPQAAGQVVRGQGLLADAADLTVPFRNAGGLHHQSRASQPEPVAPRLGPPPGPGRRLLRAGQVAAAVQGRGQPELEPGPVILAEFRLARRQRLPVQAHGFLERQRFVGRVSGRLARRHRPRPVTGQRRLDPVPRHLGQVQAQLPLVQRLDRVRRRGVQPPLLCRAEPGRHRRTDQRVREAMIAGPLAGHQESGAPCLVQRAEQAQHRPVQHLGHHPGREAVTGDRGRLQHRPRVVRQLGEPVAGGLEHPPRHRTGPAGPAGPAGTISVWASSRTRNGFPPVSSCTRRACCGEACSPAASSRSATASAGRPRSSTRSVLASADSRGTIPSGASRLGWRRPGCASRGAGGRRRRAARLTPRPPTAGHRAPAPARSARRPPPAAGGPRRTARTAGPRPNRRPGPGLRRRPNAGDHKSAAGPGAPE